MTHGNASADNLNSAQGDGHGPDANAARWIARLRARLDAPRGGAAPPAERGTMEAAVLAPLVLRQGALHVILTVRPQTLPRHAGQISFPGGRLHAEDRDEADAALRETEEEIGVAPRDVELLGRWQEIVTVGGFRVTPFIGLVAPAAIPRACPREVEEIFTVPFDFLMDPANHRRDSREWNGALRHFTAIPFHDYYIWGATASMLRTLYERLADPTG